MFKSKRVKLYLKRRALLFVVALSMLLLNSENTLAKDANYDEYVQGRIEQIVSSENITRSDAELRLRWEDQASDLSDLILKEHVNNFSGMWIGLTDNRIKIGIKDNVVESKEHIDQLAASIGMADSYDYVSTTYSYRELQETIQELSQDARNIPGAQWSFIFGIVPSKNKVRVALPPTDEWLNANQLTYLKDVKQKYGDMVFLERNPGVPAAQDDCSEAIQSCAAPLRGGVHIEDTSNYACTSGFIARGKSTGNRYVLTAGHCARSFGVSHIWYAREYLLAPSYNIRTIGQEKLNALGDSVDALLILRRNDLPYLWSTEGSVFMRDGQGVGTSDPSRNAHWDIAGYSSNAGLENQRVCASGAKTGSSCGLIIEVNISNFNMSTNWSTPIPLNGVVRYGRCSNAGDSGGPVVRGNYTHHAVGIHSAGSIGCDDYKYYTGISTILNAFDNSIELVTW